MTLSGYVYKTSAGETFDTVALACYGDEKYAAELLCANPELSSLGVFSGGERVKLPVVVTTGEYGKAASAAPWKE